jgi:hypothetical protein
MKLRTRNLPHLYQRASLVLLILIWSRNSPGSTDLMLVSAELLSVESLCEIRPLPNDFETFNMRKGTTATVLGCGNLDKAPNRPKAIRVTIKNAGKSMLEAAVDPAKVVIRTPAGQVVRLSGMRMKRIQGPTVSLDLYFTNVFGPVGINIAGGEERNWILVFPEANRGDTLQLDSIGEVPIR